MKLSKFSFLGIILSLVFAGLTFFYSDSFYLILALVLLIFSFAASINRININFSLNKLNINPFKNFKIIFKKINFKRKTKAITVKTKEALKTTKFLNFKLLLIALFLLSISFSLITSFILPEVPIKANLLLQYYFAFKQLFLSHNLIFIYLILALLALIITLILIQLIKYKKLNNLSLLKAFVIKIFLVIVTILLSFHLAFGLVYLYAYSHVSYIIIGHNQGFYKSEINSNEDSIVKKINSTKKLPKFVYFNQPYKKSLILMKVKLDKGFIRKNLMTSLPNSIYETINIPQSSIYYVDNTLLLTELNQQVIEKLSPKFGRLLVKGTYKEINLKKEPEIELLNRQEYLKVREDQINEHIAEIEVEIKELNNAIGTIYSYINEGKTLLQEAKNFLATSEGQKEGSINECKTAGENFNGQFYRYYSDDECNSLRSEWDNYIREVSANLGKIQSDLNHNQSVLADYQYALDYYKEAKNYVESSKTNTPYELGIFLPENEIKIALDSNNPDVFNAYLATLVHEYLHYTTYVSEERRIDHFFEEAFTEYFSRDIVNRQLNYSENIAYPVAVRIIEEMTEKIPAEDFRKIYFTKDQKQLENILNKTYGKSFYDDSYRFLSTINYLPLSDSIEAANTIMVRIDGDKITTSNLKLTN